MDVTREMIDAIPNKIRISILQTVESDDRVMYTYRYVHYDHFKEYPILNECRGIIFNRETGLGLDMDYKELLKSLYKSIQVV